MKQLIFILLLNSLALFGCPSLLGMNKFTSEKIVIGMTKVEFIKQCGQPLAKEMIKGPYGQSLERLIYNDGYYDSTKALVTITYAFTFEDGQLISQEVIDRVRNESNSKIFQNQNDKEQE